MKYSTTVRENANRSRAHADMLRSRVLMLNSFPLVTSISKFMQDVFHKNLKP